MNLGQEKYPSNLASAAPALWLAKIRIDDQSVVFDLHRRTFGYFLSIVEHDGGERPQLEELSWLT